MAYLAIVFSTKVQSAIWLGESRDNITPNLSLLKLDTVNITSQNPLTTLLILIFNVKRCLSLSFDADSES